MAICLLPESVQFSGHETFPLRQLWLRKAFDAVDQADDSVAAKSAFLPESGIRQFGVGKNMVASIRHWALACDVVVEQPGGKMSVGDVGRRLFGRHGLDPYLERPASAWWVHWLLAGRAKRSTTWWWVFNRITQPAFDTERLLESLSQAVEQSGHRVSQTTLKRDIDVCLRCYVARRDGREADDAAEPLLADLGLMAEAPSGTFQFQRGPHSTLPDGLFALAMLEYWDMKEHTANSGQATLSFEAIAHEFGAPGRIFKLDEHSVGDRLTRLEDISEGQLRWSDSAGVRQVSRLLVEPSDALKQRLWNHAYGK